jgi:predicted ATP-grasp superfamily ATP-dependent carboligase
MRILVAGINIRHIACSAARAGHEVIALDCFCDVDLQRCAAKTVLLSRERAKECLNKYIREYHPEAVVLGPGLEEASVVGAPQLNNPPEKVGAVSDKLWLARWLRDLGYPCIRTEDSPLAFRFPFIVKPRRGAGGVGCRRVTCPSELRWEEGLISQEMIAGRPASVSVIGSGQMARAVAVNEQLIGQPWTGARGFRYCGNITPIEPSCSGIAKMAEEIVARLGLSGSNGVDFLLTDHGPVVVEVNARFQGSLDTVELATGINLFQAHMNSFEGALPKMQAARCAAGRAIIYAPRDLVIEEELERDWTTDVPRSGSRIARDEPIISILSRGRSRNEVLADLKRKAAMLIEKIEAKRQMI